MYEEDGPEIERITTPDSPRRGWIIGVLVVIAANEQDHGTFGAGAVGVRGERSAAALDEIERPLPLDIRQRGEGVRRADRVTPFVGIEATAGCNSDQVLRKDIERPPRGSPRPPPGAARAARKTLSQPIIP